MKRFLLILIFAFSLLINGFSQNFVEIGDGTVSTSRPFYSSWNYSWSSLIYKHDDIGAAKSITKIAFDVIGSSKTLTNQKIYIKHTSLNEFTNANYEDPANNGYTLVYNGSITFSLGWTEIELSTPFEYNGTDNIAIHIENGWGQSYGPNFNSTTSTINNNKSQGSDTGFPTNTGYLNPYPNSLTNIRLYYTSTAPATPINPVPGNNRIKVNLDTALTFTLGTNTTNYDVYFGTNLSVLTKVVDNAVASIGLNSYTLPSILESSTKYYWKVVARNATETETSPIWNFTTQAAIHEFPWQEGFQEVWYGVGGDDYYSSIINTNYEDSTDWEWNGSWGITNKLNVKEDSLALYCSPASDGNFWVKTPRILLPSNQRVSFWWRNGNTLNTKTSGNDTTFFQISTDGGIHWNNIDTLSPSSAMNSYVNSIQDLSAYAGNNVYLRWYFKVNNQSASVKLFIDDINIYDIPSGAQLELSKSSYDFPNICVNGKSKFELIIRNTGIADMLVSEITSDGPFECDYTGTIVPGDADTTFVYFKPIEVGEYSNDIVIHTNGATGDHTIGLTGKGLAILNEFYETFDAVKALPEGWDKINSPNGYISGGGVEVISSTYDTYSQPYAAKIMIANDTVNPVMLISPGVTNFNTNRLTFFAKKADSNYQLNLIVGTMTDPHDASSFVPTKTIDLDSEFQSDTIIFKPTNKAPYIAFKHGRSTGSDIYTSIRIDNIAWEQDIEAVPSPVNMVSPALNATSVDIMKNPILKWTAGSSNTENYKVYVGTSATDFGIVNGETIGNNPTSYTINAELSYNTVYFWKIVPVNNVGECEDNVVWSFTTMADPTISEFPWQENFNSTPNISGKNDCPIGWAVDDANKDNNTWDILVDNASFNPFSHSAPNSMHVAFGFQPKDDYLYTPPLALKAGNTYRLTFWLHTDVDMVTGQIYKEKIKVKLGLDNEVSAMQTQIASDSIKTVDYKKVTAEFTVSDDDIYYLGFYACSDAFMYLLIIDDVKIEILNPEFTSEPILTGRAEQVYTYNVVTTDPQNDMISLTAPTKPGWLNLTDNGDGTGVLSGTPSNSGSYQIVLNASDDIYDANQEFTIEVSEANSITDFDSDSNIKIMPNPAKSYVSIKIDDASMLPCQLQMFSIIGEKVYDTFIDSEQCQIDLNSIDSGLYFVKISNGAEEYVQKLIVR